MFKRGADIHGFISRFNGLAFKAKLPREDLKMLLWEHIPANLDNALLRQAKDDTVPYEAFCRSSIHPSQKTSAAPRVVDS